LLWIKIRFEMAWRIDKAVVRGEVDNTIAGVTTARIWLLGRERPLRLTLEGDCWRDVAGTRLCFENPLVEPQHDVVSELDEDQQGVVGDITASRKMRVPTVPEEEWHEFFDAGKELPYAWRNGLYLEWFSDSNGRVLIETADFTLEVSDRSWEMDEDDEQAQRMANQHAMREFMTAVIQRREPCDDKADEADEFEWEERLKESDRLADAYQEVLEKYMDDRDSEQKEAFVMGWDGLLDAMAEESEGGEAEGLNMEAFGGVVEGSSTCDDDEESHPLQARSHEVALRAFDLVRNQGDENSASNRLISSLLQVSSKLAGALNGREEGYEPETGYVLAILKRCLSWSNEAIAACLELQAQEETDPDHRRALEQLRQTVFEVRDGIVALRRELRRN